MKTIKRFVAVLLTAGMVMSLGMTVMAYDNLNKDTNRAPYGWQWEDWNYDGVYECYYYDTTTGRKCLNPTTPDGYQLDKNGAWIVDGVVQTKTVEKQEIPIDYAAYDPAHPLANVVDAWNLKLVDTNFETGTIGTTNTVSSWNVHAMLTNQMDKYFAAPVGEYVDSVGNHIYTTQEDYDAARKTEQDLYAWYCNWLNSMDFENMSEMDKAKEIKKVLGQCRYDDNGFGNTSNFRYDYSILINKTGVCEEFAMTVVSLAKSLGLKSAVSGSGVHAYYYIQVDGKTYVGQNQSLILDYPTSDRIYLQ